MTTPDVQLVVPGRGFARVTDERPPFRFAAQTRVGFDETDAQGVVYYGRYMPYFDRARVEYLRHLGLLRLVGPAFRQFVMRANAVEYHAPAAFDDLVDVFLRVERIGRSSATYDIAAFAEDGTLLCTAKQVLVQVDSETHRPTPIDAEIRSTIESFERITAT